MTTEEAWKQINAGVALMNEGRHDEALRAIAVVIAQEPRNVHAINAVGNVYLEKREFAQALAAFNAALAEDPSIAAIHFNRGATLQNLGETEAAIGAYRRAVELDPRVAQMHSNLGGALVEAGRPEEARAAYAAALAVDPKHVLTLHRWFHVNVVASNDPHLRTAEKLVKRVYALPIHVQIELHFALSKAYRDLGRDAESFEQLRKGNAKKRAIVEYDERAELELFERVAACFTPELFERKAGSGVPTDAPIFIVGMPRSGTTLVEQILASHPAVAAGGERADFFRVLYDASIEFRANFPDWVGAVEPQGFATLGERYLRRLGALASANRRFTDKMPANVMYLGAILLAMPNARIIHTRRDPIDTCISCYTCLFSETQGFAYDLAELGRYYRAYDRLAAHWRAVLPARRYIEVQYEDVVSDVEGQSRRILDHAGLEWDPRVLAFYDTDRPVRTASVMQVRKPVYASSVGRAHRFGDGLRPLLDALSKESVSDG